MPLQHEKQARPLLRLSGGTATVVLVLLSTLQLLLSLGSMAGDSATADEPAHIAAGWLKLVYGRLDFFREQPPLMNSISALPLLVAGYDFPLPDPKDHHWAAGHAYLFSTGYESQRILMLTRLPTVLLFIALAWTAYIFVARETASRLWGVASFALVAFCPNLIAHGRLATVDMAATFFTFLSAVLLAGLIREPSSATAVFFGVAVAAAILSKISSLILLPFAALVAIFFMRRRVMVTVAISAVAALLTVHIFILAIAAEPFVRRQFPEVDTIPERLTVPLRTVAMSVEAIRNWYTGSNFALHFVLGNFSTESPWYYYPVALLYKMTIPALLLIIGAVIIRLAQARRAAPRSPAAILFLFSFLFLAVSMFSDIALGIRYVLPVFPFLFCATIITLSRAGGRKIAIAATLLVAWHVTEAIAAYPSYIGYFNQLIGSHRNADRYLIDSNLDWGQDLRRLDEWCRANGVSAIAVCYFGGGDVESDMTVASRRIWSVDYARDIPPGMHFALSRHLYRVSAWRQVSRESWREILQRRGATYVTTVGDSIDVYVMPPAGRASAYDPSIR